MDENSNYQFDDGGSDDDLEMVMPRIDWQQEVANRSGSPPSANRHDTADDDADDVEAMSPRQLDWRALSASRGR